MCCRMHKPYLLSALLIFKMGTRLRCAGLVAAAQCTEKSQVLQGYARLGVHELVDVHDAHSHVGRRIRSMCQKEDLLIVDRLVPGLSTAWSCQVLCNCWPSEEACGKQQAYQQLWVLGSGPVEPCLCATCPMLPQAHVSVLAGVSPVSLHPSADHWVRVSGRGAPSPQPGEQQCEP